MKMERNSWFHFKGPGMVNDVPVSFSAQHPSGNSGKPEVLEEFWKLELSFLKEETNIVTEVLACWWFLGHLNGAV